MCYSIIATHRYLLKPSKAKISLHLRSRGILLTAIRILHFAFQDMGTGRTDT